MEVCTYVILNSYSVDETCGCADVYQLPYLPSLELDKSVPVFGNSTSKVPVRTNQITGS